MAPLAVDPEALDGAGASVVSAGEGLGSVVSTLTTALAGCSGMAGDDPAGAAFGRSYNSSTSKLLEAMATTRNGLCRLGDGVRISAHNYSVAEAMSNVSGHGDPLPVPPSTGSVSAGSPPSAVGTGISAPPGWGWVAKYIGMIWPTGDSARLRSAAAAWNAAGTKFLVSEILGTGRPMGTIRGQHIPEGSAIDAAFTASYRSCLGIQEQCAKIATQLTAYAAKIDKVHAAILDLLARICDPLTGLKEVWEFLTDQDEDEIKKIANDIRTIVNNFTAEVDALRQEIATVVSEATTIITTMGGYAEKQWNQFLHGTDVGRALNQIGQYTKGFGEEVGGVLKDDWTYGPLRAMVNPKGWYHSWEEMIGGMAPLVGLGGDGAPGFGEAWKDLGKQVTHWDEWSENPAEAAGKSTFDLATLLVPGGPLSKLGKLSRGARDAVRGLRKPPVPEPPRPPHVEPPKPAPPARGEPAPRTEPPNGGRPAPAPPSKPAPAPHGPVPQGPTESKPLIAEKPATAETSKPPAGLSHEPTQSANHTPAAAPAPARVSVSPAGEPIEPAPATANALQPAAHGPQTAPGSGSSLPTGHPAEPGLGPEGAPGGHGRGGSSSGGDGHGSGRSSGSGGGGSGSGGGDGQGHGADGRGGSPGDRGGSGDDANHQGDGQGRGAGGGGDDSHDSHQSGDGASSDHGDTSSTGLTDEKRDEILALEKGTRPDPSEYLSQEYIEHHLEQFNHGGTRFMLDESFKQYGIGQRDGTTFVFPTGEVDALMDKGDFAAVEKALGLPDGYFKDYNVIRVDIPHLENYNLRIPSGNEAGANDYWLPGGLLPEGMPEAVIDGSEVPLEDLTVIDLPDLGRK